MFNNFFSRAEIRIIGILSVIVIALLLLSSGIAFSNDLTTMGCVLAIFWFVFWVAAYVFWNSLVTVAIPGIQQYRMPNGTYQWVANRCDLVSVRKPDLVGWVEEYEFLDSSFVNLHAGFECRYQINSFIPRGYIAEFILTEAIRSAHSDGVDVTLGENQLKFKGYLDEQIEKTVKVIESAVIDALEKGGFEPGQYISMRISTSIGRSIPGHTSESFTIDHAYDVNNIRSAKRAVAS